MNSVRNRLALLFFAITAAAIGFVYLYVVPQLRSSLTAESLARLDEVAGEQSARLAAAMREDASQARLRRLIRDIAARSQARVTVLAVRGGPAGAEPAFVVGDSGIERTALVPDYPAARAAVGSPSATASAIERIGGERIGETAVAISAAGEPRWVAVLSTPLDGVDDNVALIRRQILIAGGIALVAALLAGWFAARWHAHRLRRLEQAAEKIADGDFTTAIPVTSQDEVGQLAATFNEMRARLDRLDSARKEFIANASHELRTPIFSLGGFVELLSDEDPDPASRAEFVQTMREQVARLTKLTADLLDLSKLDADALQVHPEQVDAAELAATVADEFTPALARHGKRLELIREGPVAATCDRDRVAQILRILIDNALVHTPEGTTITLTAKPRDGAASLGVRDDGPGIGPRARSKVFERFYTGDEVGGSGLGLAIARELAMRMGGSLELSSRRGRTEFELLLPLAAPVAAGTA